MKLLLLPLLASHFLPNADKAESVLLVVMTTIGSMLREEGQKLVSSERFIKGKFGKITRDISFECLESK